MSAETLRTLSDETLASIQHLYASVCGSESFYAEAAQAVAAAPARSLFEEIVRERRRLAIELANYLRGAGVEPQAAGTFLDKAHELWTRLRASLNSGTLPVLLIETERAEDRLQTRYERAIMDTAGSALNDVLLRHYRGI